MMEASLKRILRGISLELRHTLEGWHDKKTGAWNPGDLERRLNEIGVWSDRPSKPLDEMPHLSAEDKAARCLVDCYLQLRAEAGAERAAAVAEFVRESAYTWANRLFAFRCMEARSIIEEVILQKAAYAGRSLVHQRFLRKNPDAAKGEDDGLFAVLFAEFAVRAQELPALFNPNSPAVALRPSVAAVKRCVTLLSGTETVRGQDAATDEVFAAPDAFGWAYQYWNADEKDRVFEMVRTKKGAKIQGADIIPATQLYTEPYMVKFLVQNSLGALWMGMYPDSELCERWEYYVKDADRAPVTPKPVREITFLDPAQGSGHFHLEAFDLFYAMYEEEAARQGYSLTPREIAAAILNHNLYGIDIDGRSVQIATAALWMKAKERAPELEAGDLTSFHEHLVATNIRLPKGKDHLELFLQKHPEDKDLRPALEQVFQGLEHADELGALLRIEELVDSVLRQLKEAADKSKGTVVQVGLFEPTLVQGMLPVSVESYDKWKREALDRLQAHFEAEAQAADTVQAFFGESASKGLTFFNLLAQRYDVVTANPPYMGSKNMGDEVKAYVQRHFLPGKRDLYAAFILRCIALARPSGRVAMVTQQSWMFLRSFAELRAVDTAKLPRLRDNDFKGLLRETMLETLVHLGEHAFEDSSAAGAFAAVFTFAVTKPPENHRLSAFRITGPKSPDEKIKLLRQSLYWSTSFNLSNQRCHPVFSQPRQIRFLDITQSPLSYWLPEVFMEMMHSVAPVSNVSYVRQGICTTNNSRFVRGSWEIGAVGVKNRWVLFAKGGGAKRWSGFDQSMVDWEFDGIRIKSYQEDTPGAIHWKGRMPDPSYFFKSGWTFSRIARGNLALREMPKGSLFGHTSPAAIPFKADDFVRIGFWLNTRIFSFLLRSVNQSVDCQEGYVQKLPLPDVLKTEEMAPFVTSCSALRREINRSEIHEWLFDFSKLDRKPSLDRFATEAVYAALDGQRNIVASMALSLGSSETALVADDVGIEPGRFPVLHGYDALPALPVGLAVIPREALDHLSRHERRQLADAEFVELLRRLRQLYEAGPGGSSDEGDSDGDAEENDEEEESPAVGARLPIPAETFMEELSQKLEVHPISVYWLLKDGIEREGWRCFPEERRLTEDGFTVLVLRLLGHRWPKQIEAAEPLPAWADQDGVIPLTNGGGEMPLIERIRERLAEDFPRGNVAALEREFEGIVGASLEQWLAGPFFERHISQFKKRPIAWQLETVASRQAAVAGGKGKKKRTVAGKPVFACLVYYHKLDADLLPKLRTQYVGLLRGGYETEFRTLERLANPTSDHQERRLQLEQWIDELQAFDRLLEVVSLRGFGPDALRPALRQYGINDALLSLTASWLRCLAETVAKGPLPDWVEAAAKTELHPELPKWLQDSMANPTHFCAALGPKPPTEKSFESDPTTKELAPLVAGQARAMVEGSLKLSCERWWKPLDEAVLEPLRQEIKAAKAEIEHVDKELKREDLTYQRRNELGERKHELKEKVKSLKSDHDEKSDVARKIRVEIERWTCPEAETWGAWLSAEPMFDAVASLDGHRPPPQTIADFITQESRYAPDINDGVRVNIAPIQKAGLLHADVLDAKDADKAIADRAEWRADERRWVREGKLPQPGWWPANGQTSKLATSPWNKT